MLCELNGSVTFERLLAKFAYFVRQRVPPISNDSGFELAFKRLIAKHRAVSGNMCLSAQELDQLDLVLGHGVVKRCSVCFRPTDGRDFHVDCAVATGHCLRCCSSDIRGIGDTIVGQCHTCNKTSWPMKADVRLVPRDSIKPGNSKVSRKRVASPRG